MTFWPADYGQHTPIRTEGKEKYMKKGVRGVGASKPSGKKLPAGTGRNYKQSQTVGIESPRTSRCLRNKIESRDFVKMSAGISAVGIHVVRKEPSCTCARMKWWRISMCLERAEMAMEFEREQAAWLSDKMGKVLDLVLKHFILIWLHFAFFAYFAYYFWHSAYFYIIFSDSESPRLDDSSDTNFVA